MRLTFAGWDEYDCDNYLLGKYVCHQNKKISQLRCRDDLIFLAGGLVHLVVF